MSSTPVHVPLGTVVLSDKLRGTELHTTLKGESHQLTDLKEANSAQVKSPSSPTACLNCGKPSQVR